MLKNANRSFLAIVCAFFALCAGTTAVAQKAPKKQEQTIIPVLDGSKQRSRNIRDRIGVEDPVPSNAIRVSVRYRKEYGYHWAEGATAGSGPTSCDEFVILPQLGEGDTRPRNPIPIGGDSQMQESLGYYTCKYLVSGLPFNVPVKITATIANNREAWEGGSLAQPPPGQQRVIQNGIQTATLTEAQPRATLVFEMVYAPVTLRRARAHGKTPYPAPVVFDAR